MPERLTIQKSAEIATPNKVWRSVVQAQDSEEPQRMSFFNGSFLLDFHHFCTKQCIFKLCYLLSGHAYA